MEDQLFDADFQERLAAKKPDLWASKDDLDPESCQLYLSLYPRDEREAFFDAWTKALDEMEREIEKREETVAQTEKELNEMGIFLR